MKTNPLYVRPDGSQRTSTRIVDGQVRHNGRRWKCGRRISRRFEAIVQISGLTLSDVARLSANINDTSSLMLARKEDISKTLSGRRNTPRYVQALESAWGLPIQELRRILREDKERLESGNPWTAGEIAEFAKWYRENRKF